MKNSIFLILILALFSTSYLDAKEELSISLTVSGGVSYGSYQGGYLYVLNDWLRINHDNCKLRIVTGASAGAINAFLSVLALADPNYVVDTQSVFYKTWIPVSFNKLNCGKSALGVFGRDFFEELKDSLLFPLLSKPPHGYPIEILLGVTATRLTPLDLKIADKLSVPTLEQKFIMHMSKDSSNGWVIRNYIDSTSNCPTVVLPFRNKNLHGIVEKDNDINLITSLLYTSSGLPFAFEPLSIQHWNLIPSEINGVNWEDTGAVSLWDNLSRLPDSITPSEPSLTNFIDGGVFDNSPLRLAAETVNKGLEYDSIKGIKWVFLPSTNLKNSAVEHVHFLYFSQENMVFPQPSISQQEIDSSLVTTTMKLFGNFINSARTKELGLIQEQFPKIKKSLTSCYAPSMSGYLVNTLGFFEKPFRMFDFYLGMYDARRYLNEYYRKNPDFKGYDFDLPVLDDTISDVRFQLTKKVLDLIYSTVEICNSQRDFIPDSVYWKTEIKAIDEWVRIKIASDTLTDKKGFERHAIMLQSSIDRLYGRWECFFREDNCWTADRYQVKAWKKMIAYRPTFFTTVYNMEPINNKDFNKKIVSTISNGARCKIFGKTEFDALMYSLDKYEYCYEDIVPGKKASARKACKALSEKFYKISMKLAKNQKSKNERKSIEIIAKPLTNTFAYGSPKNLFRIGIGTGGVSIGCSHRFQILNNIDWETYLTVNKGSRFNRGKGKWFFCPNIFMPFSTNIGLTFDILNTSSSYQLKTGPSFGIGKDWTVNSTSDHYYSSWIIYPGINVQVSRYDFIYLRFSYQLQKEYNYRNWNSEVEWNRNVFNTQAGIQFTVWPF